MNRPHRRRFAPLPPSSVTLFAMALCCALGAARAPAQDKAVPLGKGATEALVARYGEAEHWVQKVVVILSLNDYWHPAGVDMLIEAMKDRDERLRAFGLEALHRCDDELLPMIATKALLDELITRQVKASNDRYQERVVEALKRLVPDAGVDDVRDWGRWWREHEETHAPAEWKERPQPDARDGGTAAAATRAFDLYQSGLDMMLVIDSTGSMQPTIDAVSAALGEMVDILDGISPKLRLGVVHYKDHGELGKEGAKFVQPFTKNVKTVRKKLEKLRAYGGGDLPEAVLGGLVLALSREAKWEEEANKIAIVIGDAPPHPTESDTLIALARAAREDPAAQLNGGKPVTGQKQPPRPFLTSAIGVFLKVGRDVKVGPGFKQFEDSQKVMRNDFKALAEAGGGVFVDLEFEINSATPPTSKDRREAKKEGGGAASEATRSIVEHILVLSFGERFKTEMHDFVRIFFDYKRADFFK